jgi:hypothetical protein
VISKMEFKEERVSVKSEHKKHKKDKHHKSKKHSKHKKSLKNTMENYEHLCLYERQRIQRYLRKQKSLRFISDKLERSVSSISDEIRNNKVGGVYDAKKAQS